MYLGLVGPYIDMTWRAFASAVLLKSMRMFFIPLYSVVKIQGSTGWKSMPLTLSLRANSCLCILKTELAVFGTILPTTLLSRSCRLLFGVFGLGVDAIPSWLRKASIVRSSSRQNSRIKATNLDV